jgi:hypothetical protein
MKLDVIDADAHVVENERVWDYLDASEEKYRPTLVTSPEDPKTPGLVSRRRKILVPSSPRRTTSNRRRI